MKLPNVGYEPEWIGDEEVSFFPKKYSTDEDLVHIKLPKWLVDSINHRIDRAREEGKQEVKDRLNQLLGRSK